MFTDFRRLDFRDRLRDRLRRRLRDRLRRLRDLERRRDRDLRPRRRLYRADTDVPIGSAMGERPLSIIESRPRVRLYGTSPILSFSTSVLFQNEGPPPSLSKRRKRISIILSRIASFRFIRACVLM